MTASAAVDAPLLSQRRVSLRNDVGSPTLHHRQKLICSQHSVEVNLFHHVLIQLLKSFPIGGQRATGKQTQSCATVRRRKQSAGQAKSLR